MWVQLARWFTNGASFVGSLRNTNPSARATRFYESKQVLHGMCWQMKVNKFNTTEWSAHNLCFSPDLAFDCGSGFSLLSESNFPGGRSFLG